MSFFRILPECYADTLLVEILGFRSPSHKNGISEVIKAFDKDFKNTKAVGIIDDDKRKPTDLKDFVFEEEREHIQRCFRSNGRHTILIISPAFEDWVFNNAKTVGIQPADYGFKTPKYFRSVCKDIHAPQNQQLKQFLNTLKQKKAPGFVQLKRWICEELGLDEVDL